MSKLTVTLDAPAQRFVTDQVASGAYPDADAVVRAAVDLLKGEAEDEARKEARFRALVQEGLDDLAAGRFEIVDDVEAWMSEVKVDAAG